MRLGFPALVFVFAAAGPASAQGLPLAELTCRTEVAGTRIEGTVLADLWQYAGSTGVGWTGDRAQMNILMRMGRADEIPGTVRLFGHLFDPLGNLVNFEVFLTRGNSGTGSFWINGARHRETFMTLTLRENGFLVEPEAGAPAIYECDAEAAPATVQSH